METLRLIFPEWQGGVNPNYVFGANILSYLAPFSKNSETVKIPVNMDFEIPLEKENGYYAGEVLVQQQIKAKEILREKKPKKVITFGGDCSVSQAPFDYLHELYPDDLGIIWIDAHPDISSPQDTEHEHAMVLGNLLGDGAAELSGIVKFPFDFENIIYVGLIADGMLPNEMHYIKQHKMAYITPKELTKNSDRLLTWLNKNKFTKVAIHFDVDVLSSNDFRSVLYNEPGSGPVDYATGTMTVADVLRVIKDTESTKEVVGLTIAEYIPWDLIKIGRAMQKIKIFE